MTVEQLPPEPQEHRWSRWWPFDGVARAERMQTTELMWTDGSPAMEWTDGGPAMDDPKPADPAEQNANGSVLQGEVLSDDQLAARELAHQKEQAAAERVPLSPTFRQELRMQLADFAERAHQKRLNPASPEMLGSGGGITEQVVQAMAKAISAQNLPGPAGSHEDQTDLLLGALAATDPKEVDEAGHVSFVTLRGRLMLDVSTAAIDGESLTTEFIRLPSRSARARRMSPDQDAAADDAAGSHGDGELPGRYAAVICGPAAVIAGGRPFLGMDALTTYARREAFARFSNGGPHAGRSGMLAAHSIEIVVLLDPSLDGGVWVDVDPATGLPAAAMSIAIRPAGFRFTRLAAA